MSAIVTSLRKVLSDLEARMGKLVSAGDKVLVQRLIKRLRAVLDALSKADNLRLDARLHKLLRELLAAAAALLEALHTYLRSLESAPEEQSRARAVLVEAMSDFEAALDAIEVALGLGHKPGGISP